MCHKAAVSKEALQLPWACHANSRLITLFPCVIIPIFRIPPCPAPTAINTLISTADILQSWGSSLHCNLAILRKRLWISFSAISVLWTTRDKALFRGRQRNFQVIYELGIQNPLLTFFSPAMFMKLVILKKCYQVSKDMVTQGLTS